MPGRDRVEGMATSQHGEVSALPGAPPKAFADSNSIESRDLGHLLETKSNDEIAPCLTVVMPVYNEEATVAGIVRKVLEQRPVQELIIVDDCSTDNTWQI